MHEIPVPFGINNSGHLIAAQSIQVGGTYTCPYCGEALMCDLSSMQNKMLIHPKTNNCISLSDSKTELDALNVIVLGISPDTPKKLTNFINKQELNFTLLADEDHSVCEKYHVFGN